MGEAIVMACGMGDADKTGLRCSNRTRKNWENVKKTEQGKEGRMGRER